MRTARSDVDPRPVFRETPPEEFTALPRNVFAEAQQVPLSRRRPTLSRLKKSQMTSTSRTVARRTAAIGVALAVMAQGGCAGNQADDVHTGPTEQPYVLTYEVAQDEERIYLDALWQGQLEVDEHSGCIQEAGSGADHATETGPKPVGMVFPEGTEVTSDGTEIHLPSGGTIPIGPEVSLGGGYFPSAPVTPSPSPGYDEYFMVNDAPE
ncbi:hypothetical protein DRB07_10435 [Actinomyces sp. Z3]|nr:hypothetical protein DRB07_10435 [Actinomyces sp. Z3]